MLLKDLGLISKGSEHCAVQKGQRHLRAQDTGLAYLRESQGQKLGMSVCPVLVQPPRGSVARLRGWDNYIPKTPI